jgi:hypothetical protein
VLAGFLNEVVYKLKSLCIQEHKALDPFNFTKLVMAPKDLAGTSSKNLAGILGTRKGKEKTKQKGKHKRKGMFN